MIKFNPENKEVLTYGEALHPAMEVTTKEEAEQYFKDYVAYLNKYVPNERTDGKDALVLLREFKSFVSDQAYKQPE